MNIIKRFVESTQDLVPQEFKHQEQRWFQKAVSNLETEDISLCTIPFNQLCDSTGENAVRAIEFSSEIVNTLVAVDNWLQYRQTDNLYYLLCIAVSITDTLDYYLNGDWDSEIMLAEIEYQRCILAGQFTAPIPRYNWTSCQQFSDRI